jgi:transcriptional regulator with PAS, ATPase and Fis domain
MADGGTLFLDEIGEISLKNQVDLLRVLQEKTIYRVGSTTPTRIDIRIISATNRDLEIAIKEGDFREDLYYRLNVVTVNVPPLRDREGDIRLLANHFLKKYTEQNSKQIDSISEECMDLMNNYHWPGNVRELENVIESSVVLCKTGEISTSCMPRILLNRSKNNSGLKSSKLLKDSERNQILKVLSGNNWNISKSARDLGIDRVTLYNKIKRYDLQK